MNSNANLFRCAISAAVLLCVGILRCEYGCSAMRDIVESPNWEQLLSPRFDAYCAEDGHSQWREDADYFVTEDFLHLFSSCNPIERRMAQSLLYRFVIYTRASQLFLYWNEDGSLSVVEPANNLYNTYSKILPDSDEIMFILRIVNDTFSNLQWCDSSD